MGCSASCIHPNLSPVLLVREDGGLPLHVSHPWQQQTLQLSLWTVEIATLVQLFHISIVRSHSTRYIATTSGNCAGFVSHGMTPFTEEHTFAAALFCGVSRVINWIGVFNYVANMGFAVEKYTEDELLCLQTAAREAVGGLCLSSVSPASL